ncbi:hypothetical protein EDB81DRAFT_943854 [Dactylonectria macrodidyma]|uniref:NACHT domain-containing protein n=1 Tax=Dactylonectria macrodidyma TaxID=307937 RepID=A0A9P9FGM3_9HYPO|nr:hypothetical protein EDB81DRAFT_943854 [Dactylonectria macrodidyma]
MESVILGSVIANCVPNFPSRSLGLRGCIKTTNIGFRAGIGAEIKFLQILGRDRLASHPVVPEKGATCQEKSFIIKPNRSTTCYLPRAIMALRNRQPLEVVYESSDSVEVDIIAVHGLGANVDWSWTWRDKTDKTDPPHLVNWQKDPGMLPAIVPKSRIILYNYDSRWHANAPRTRLQLCGEDFARAVHAFRRTSPHRPIVFVGHSLGGNVIQHGLLYANSENEFRNITTSVAGVVFLGSPLRGTKLHFLPQLLTTIMSPAGSHGGVIEELAYDNPGLRDKLHDFCRMLNTLSIPASCFFELYESDYGRRKQKMFSGIIKGIVVDETSACIPGHNRISLQADHFDMNKFSDPKNRSFLSVSDEIRKMSKNAQDIIERRAQPHPIITDRRNVLTRNSKARDCLRALFLTDPFEDMKAMKRKKGRRATGTCEWILGSESLTAWLSGKCAPSPKTIPTNVLWLYGNPGTGKTTMSIFLAEELPRIFSATDQKTLAYFFCDSSYDTRKTTTGVIRGLLLQLLQQHPSLLRHVSPKFDERGVKVFDSFDAIWEMLMKVTSDKATGRKYCIIDALDECEPSSQEILLSQLQETFSPNSTTDHDSNLSILITSRPYPEIREFLNVYSNQDLSGFEESKQDIDKFIGEKVAHLKEKKKYTIKVAHQVAQILREKSENTFLWIGLACEELSLRGFASKDAVKRLQALPRGLHSLYKNLLDTAIELGTDNGATIKDLLGFIVVALRPLTVLELGAACGLYQDESEEERVQFTMEEIESCRLMVVVQDDTVLFLHQSVKDFLIRPSGSDGQRLVHELQAHATLATRCIDYLIEITPNAPLPSWKQLEHVEFLLYASNFWPEHARMAESQFLIKDSQAEFFNVVSASREAWLAFLRVKRASFSRRNGAIPKSFSVFHVAARWGIAQMVDHALDSKSKQGAFAQEAEFVDSSFVNSWGQTPLEEAAYSGHVNVMRCLLDRAGADMSVPESVVSAAARNLKNGHEVLDLLLELKGDQIITEGVAIAAAKNERIGDLIVAVLPDRMADKIITEGVAIAAIKNLRKGNQILTFLLDRKGNQAITEKVAIAAAENCTSDRMMALLLDRKGNQIISEEVAVAAAKNNSLGDRILALLLDRKGNQIITEKVTIAAAKNRRKGYQMMTLLLGRIGNQIITEGVAIAAIGNSPRSRQIMTLLLDLEGDQITITEKLLIAVASNGRAEEIMTLLLDRKGDQITITQEVTKAVASNRWRGVEIMTLLLYRKGHQMRRVDVFDAIKGLSWRDRVMGLLDEILPVTE